MGSTGVVPQPFGGGDNFFAPPNLQPVPTEQERVPYIPPNVEGLPPQAGWAGTGGQIANIAANFLNGWMKGKAVHEENMRRNATQKLNSAWSAYNMAMQIANNENLPADQRAAAASQLAGLKGLYIDQVRAFSPGGGKKAEKGAAGTGRGTASGGAVPSVFQGDQYVGEGVKAPGMTPSPDIAGQQPQAAPQQPQHDGKLHAIASHVARVFTAQKPEMFASGMADLLEKTMPEGPALPNVARQAQVRTMGASATQAENVAALGGQQVKLGDLNLAGQQQIWKQRQHFDEVASRLQHEDPNSQDAKMDQAELLGIKGTLANYGIKTFTPEELKTEEAQHQLEGEVIQQKASAMQNIAAGKPMNWYEATILGMQPRDTLDVYLQNVGPNRRFADSNQAVIQMLKDQGEMYKSMYGFRSPWLQAEQNVRQMHPDWSDQQVAQGVMIYMRGTGAQREGMTTGGTGMMPGGRPLTPKDIPLVQREVLQNVVAAFPEYSDFFSHKVKTSAGEQTAYGLEPQPEYSGIRHVIPGMDNPDEAAGKWQAKRQEALETARQTMRNMGFDEAAVTRVFGAAAPQQAGGPQAMTPTPTATPQGTQMKQYTVTDQKGNTKTLAMTDADAALAQSRGIKVVPMQGGKK